MTWDELRTIWGGVRRVHDVRGTGVKREHAANVPQIANWRCQLQRRS